MTTTRRSYRVIYRDGSEEFVEAYDIREARTEAEELYSLPIRKIAIDSERNQDAEIAEEST